MHGLASKFEVRPASHGTLPVKVQKELLEPFKLVSGKQQKCSITGSEEMLAKEVVEAMTPNIHWAVAAAWEAYDLALTKKELGDRAYNAGKYLIAHESYKDTLIFMIDCNCAIPAIAGVEDDNHYNSWYLLRMVIMLNLAWASIRLGWETTDCKRYGEIVGGPDCDLSDLPYMTAPTLATLAFARGVAYFALTVSNGRVVSSEP